MAISNRIKQIRKRLTLSQKTFADKIGVDQGRVSQWETERSQPSSSALSEIVRLGVNVNWLLTGEGEMMQEALSSENEDVFTEKQRRELEKIINGILDARMPIKGKTR